MQRCAVRGSKSIFPSHGSHAPWRTLALTSRSVFPSSHACSTVRRYACLSASTCFLICFVVSGRIVPVEAIACFSSSPGSISAIVLTYPSAPPTHLAVSHSLLGSIPRLQPLCRCGLRCDPTVNRQRQPAHSTRRNSHRCRESAASDHAPESHHTDVKERCDFAPRQNCVLASVVAHKTSFPESLRTFPQVRPVRANFFYFGNQRRVPAIGGDSAQCHATGKTDQHRIMTSDRRRGAVVPGVAAVDLTASFT